MIRKFFLLLALPVLGPCWFARVILFGRYGLRHRPWSFGRMAAVYAFRPHRSRWL